MRKSSIFKRLNKSIKNMYLYKRKSFKINLYLDIQCFSKKKLKYYSHYSVGYKIYKNNHNNK